MLSLDQFPVSALQMQPDEKLLQVLCCLSRSWVCINLKELLELLVLCAPADICIAADRPQGQLEKSQVRTFIWTSFLSGGFVIMKSILFCANFIPFWVARSWCPVVYCFIRVSRYYKYNFFGHINVNVCHTMLKKSVQFGQLSITISISNLDEIRI